MKNLGWILAEFVPLYLLYSLIGTIAKAGTWGIGNWQLWVTVLLVVIYGMIIHTRAKSED